MKDIIQAMLMKLAWSFLIGRDGLEKFLRYKFLDKNRDVKKYYKKFIIWPGVKERLKEI